MTDTVGKHLKALRERMGWSQPALAKLVNDATGWRWHQTTIAKLEAGTRSLQFEEALAYRQVLGVSLNDLAYGDPEPHLAPEDFSSDPYEGHAAMYAETARFNRPFDEAHKTRIRVIDWEIQVHRERIEELQRQRYAEIQKVSEYDPDYPYEPDPNNIPDDRKDDA